jgi:hypothetical protein
MKVLVRSQDRQTQCKFFVSCHMGGKCRYSRLFLIDQFASKIASQRVERSDSKRVERSIDKMQLAHLGLTPTCTIPQEQRFRFPVPCTVKSAKRDNYLHCASQFSMHLFNKIDRAGKRAPLFSKQEGLV